jgi:hypothetical protein
MVCSIYSYEWWVKLNLVAFLRSIKDLKAFTDPADTTFDGRSFHGLIILWLKKFLCTSKRYCFFYSFKLQSLAHTYAAAHEKASWEKKYDKLANKSACITRLHTTREKLVILWEVIKVRKC